MNDVESRLQEKIAQLKRRVRELEDSPQWISTLAERDALIAILANLPVMLVAFDENDRILWWNEECVRVTGFPSRRIVNNPRGLYRLYPNRGYRRELRNLRKEHGGQYRGLEWKVTCADGSERVISWSNISRRVPIPGWDSWEVGIDVTEQHAAETQLRRQLAILKAVVDGSQDAIYMKDLDGYYLLANPPLAELLNCRVDDMIGREDADLVGEDRARATSQEDEQVLRSGCPAVSEVEALVEGEDRTYETRKSPCRDANSQLIGLVGIARDVTDQRAAERDLRRTRDELEVLVTARTRELRVANQKLTDEMKQLQEVKRRLEMSEERFRLIAETVPIPISISRVDDATIRYANPQMGTTFGLPTSQLIGRKATEFYDAEALRGDIMKKLSKDRRIDGLEMPVQLHSGDAAWISVSIVPIDYESAPCLLAGVLDITQRKQSEDLLRDEQRLLKRLVDLHEQDRQLVSYEIHDGIVQDMTASLMFLEAFQHSVSEMPETKREHLTQGITLLRNSIDEARRLINGLKPPILEELGLVAALEHLIDDMACTSGIDIHFTHDVHFRRLAPAFELAVYRIVQESLNNVWHHSKSPDAHVSVVHANGSIRIVVEDTGVGFDPAEADSRRHGLAGIKERSRLLCGRVRITSQRGQGTRVCVEFPVSNAMFSGEGK